MAPGSRRLIYRHDERSHREAKDKKQRMMSDDVIRIPGCSQESKQSRTNERARDIALLSDGDGGHRPTVIARANMTSRCARYNP